MGYECFHCGFKSVHWCGDFTFEEYGRIDSDGIVHVCECDNCGAEIEYYIAIPYENQENE